MNPRAESAQTNRMQATSSLALEPPSIDLHDVGAIFFLQWYFNGRIRYNGTYYDIFNDFDRIQPYSCTVQLYHCTVFISVQYTLVAYLSTSNLVQVPIDVEDI